MSTTPQPPPQDEPSEWPVVLPGAEWGRTLVGPEPDWAALRRAVTPEPLFRWVAAHPLTDGTRVDEFVHRSSTLMLLIGSDGRVWHCRGASPGGEAGFMLLEVADAPEEAVAHVLAASHCDRWLHEADRARSGRLSWDDVEPRPCDAGGLGHLWPDDDGR